MGSNPAPGVSDESDYGHTLLSSERGPLIAFRCVSAQHRITLSADLKELVTPSRVTTSNVAEIV